MFAYCNNNPVMYVDPNGEYCVANKDSSDTNYLDDWLIEGGGVSGGSIGGGFGGGASGRNQLRVNMIELFGNPGAGYQAHHGLPWAFKDYFDAAGININNPFFGRWVKGGGNGGHQSWSYRYNKIWENYINNHALPNAADIIDYFLKLNGGK